MSLPDPTDSAQPEWMRRQERSNLAILRLMVWISLTFGRGIGRVVLHAIAAYFVLFAPAARRAHRPDAAGSPAAFTRSRPTE